MVGWKKSALELSAFSNWQTIHTLEVSYVRKEKLGPFIIDLKNQSGQNF